MSKINGLDLFSGIGGITLGLGNWVEPIAYCEINLYCRSVLLSRMSEGRLPTAPIWDDVRTLEGHCLPPVDIISGGFPCQDISAAGAGEGLEGKRSGLFREIVRLTREIGPKFVFLENVPAIRTRGLSEVVKAFFALGYDCRWTCLSAKEVGAPHRRSRWFLLAHANGQGLERLERHKVARTSLGLPSNILFQEDWEETLNSCSRKGDELPRPVDRIKSLGNAVVPEQAKEAFQRLMGFE